MNTTQQASSNGNSESIMQLSQGAAKPMLDRGHNTVCNWWIITTRQLKPFCPEQRPRTDFNVCYNETFSVLDDSLDTTFNFNFKGVTPELLDGVSSVVNQIKTTQPFLDVNNNQDTSQMPFQFTVDINLPTTEYFMNALASCAAKAAFCYLNMTDNMTVKYLLCSFGPTVTLDVLFRSWLIRALYNSNYILHVIRVESRLTTFHICNPFGRGNKVRTANMINYSRNPRGNISYITNHDWFNKPVMGLGNNSSCPIVEYKWFSTSRADQPLIVTHKLCRSLRSSYHEETAFRNYGKSDRVSFKFRFHPGVNAPSIVSLLRELKTIPFTYHLWKDYVRPGVNVQADVWVSVPSDTEFDRILEAYNAGLGYCYLCLFSRVDAKRLASTLGPSVTMERLFQSWIIRALCELNYSVETVGIIPRYRFFHMTLLWGDDNNYCMNVSSLLEYSYKPYGNLRHITHRDWSYKLVAGVPGEPDIISSFDCFCKGLIIRLPGFCYAGLLDNPLHALALGPDIPLATITLLETDVYCEAEVCHETRSVHLTYGGHTPWCITKEWLKTFPGDYTVGRVGLTVLNMTFYIVFSMMLNYYYNMRNNTPRVIQHQTPLNGLIVGDEAEQNGMCWKKLFHIIPDLGKYPTLAAVLKECMNNPSNVKSHAVISLGPVCHVSFDSGAGLYPHEIYRHGLKWWHNLARVGADHFTSDYLTLLPVITTLCLIGSKTSFVCFIIALTIKIKLLLMGEVDALYSLILVLIDIIVLANRLSKPSLVHFKIFTFGSKGDQIPLVYYSRLLRSYGFRCSQYDHFSDSEGKEALALVEDGNFLALTGDLARVVPLIKEWRSISNHHYSIVPQDGLGLTDGVISYDLAPPPNRLKSWKMGPKDTIIQRLVNVCFRIGHLMSQPDIRIGSFRYCAPRSSNGVDLLKLKVNRPIRKTLVALGSSSIPEPTDLDINSTWSTRPSSIYKYEGRKNHVDFMCEYETVLTHGGAGTMATAASCGCHVKSLSDLIDRNYINDIEFCFSSHHFWFWHGVLQRVSYNDAVTIMITVARNDFKIGLVLFAYYSMFTFITVVQVIHMFSYWFTKMYTTCHFSASPLEIVIAFLKSGVVFEINPFVTFMVITSLKAWLNSKKPKDIKENLFWYVNRACKNSLLICTDPQWSLVRATMGPLVALILYDIFNVVNKSWWSIILTVILKSLYSLSYFKDNRSNNITIRFVKLESRVLRWFPLYHTEFVNKLTGNVVGIGVENRDVMRCVYYDENLTKPCSFEINTGINVSEWDRLKKKIKRFDGIVYSPFSNCQTASFIVRCDFDGGFDMIILYCLLIFSVMLSFILGFGVTLVLMVCCVGGFHTGLLAWCSPLMTALGTETDFRTLKELLWFVAYPSTSVYTPPLVGPSNYPDTEASLTPFERSGYMTLIRKGESVVYERPYKGAHRCEYKDNRNGNTSLPHGLIDLSKGPNPIIHYIYENIDKFVSANIKSLQGDVAVIATSKERKVGLQWLDKLRSLYDVVIVITNDDSDYDGCLKMRLDCSGRSLSCARVSFPKLDGVRWFCFNSSHDNRIPVEEILIAGSNTASDIETYDFVSVVWYGLHQASCSALMYYGRPPVSDWINPDVYGADEVVWLNKKGLLFVHDSKSLFSQVYKTGFDTNGRKINIFEFNNGYIPICSYYVEKWDGRSHLEGIQSAEKGPFVPLIHSSDSNFYIGNKLVKIGPLASRIYGSGDCVSLLRRDFLKSHQSLLKRLVMMSNVMIETATSTILDDSCWDFLETVENVLQVFNWGERPLTKVYSPLLKYPNDARIEELKLAIHPNPRFIEADYDETLCHYLSHLNSSGKYALSSHEFVRKIQRNPHVDTILRNRVSAIGIPDGIDGQVIANRELMIASLAKYAYSQQVDALLLDDIRSVSEVIVATNPDLYVDARIADPRKLVNHFMKHKKFSAGLPFIGNPTAPNETKIKTRSDLKRAGWLKPIAKLALAPYETGDWYPGLAHAFSKSQVVNFEKLSTNPAKLRSVVATSPVCNVQQGVLFFDLNNRHAPHDGPSKVGITLNGNALGSVFKDLSKYKIIYSLDATEFDRSMEHSIFAVEAAIRKAGFKNHSAYEAISKHIDCAIKQTQYSYIVNLIDDSWDAVASGSAGEGKRLFESITPETKELIKRTAAETEYKTHPTAPGGIVKKIHGGATGDSNTTYTNTVALDLILVYSVSKAHGWKFDEFFEKCGLANTGDDNILGSDLNLDLPKVFKIAKEKFGITFRVESTGNTIYDQVFLGKIPKPGLQFVNDFEKNGLAVPDFAVIHEPTKLLMRYANFKADSKKNFKNAIARDLYLLKKGVGYLNLTAHQKNIYDEIANDLKKVIDRLPSKVKRKQLNQIKIPSYDKVIRDWYKPGSLETKGSVQKLKFTVEPLIRTEQAIKSFTRSIRILAESIPSQLTLLRDEGILEPTKDILDTKGIFESHSFHTFIARNGRKPSLMELEENLKSSNYYSLSDPKTWYENVGVLLPTEGPQFDRNLNYSILMFCWYSVFYLQSSKILNGLNSIRFGGVILDIFKLTTFSSRNIAGGLNYAHYGMTGKASQLVSGLVPKDPYKYHKILAYHLTSGFKLPTLLSLIPVSKLAFINTKIVDMIAGLNSNTLFQNKDDALNDFVACEDPWVDAVSEALEVVNNSKTVVISAPTGTGKTKYIPKILKNALPDKIIMVVMPRRVLCDEFSKYPGIEWVRRGQTSNSRIQTCTYGYLQMRYINNNLSDDYFYVFDEAHETSCEWIVLRENLILTKPCILLTATPTTWMNKFQEIRVVVETNYPVTTIPYSGDLKELIAECSKKYKRVLVIHPSKKKVEALGSEFKSLGFKIMTADSRQVPATGNVIATSIVDAGLTLPGCDCVIDSGLRVVNNLGDLLTVPVDTATSLQRKGRTGRTCKGDYYLLKQVVNDEYRPSPSTISVLADDSVAVYFNVECHLVKAPIAILPGDNYVHLKNPVKRKIEQCSLSLFVKLLNTCRSRTDAIVAYERLYRGLIDENNYYLLETSGVEGSILSVPELRSCYKRCAPYYINNLGLTGSVSNMSNNKLDISGRGWCDEVS